jgi:hypothetical protein
VDTLVTEFGPSQFEINLYHQDCALRACDQGSMLKRAIRSVAHQHDKMASFMAKPFAEQVGNGMHIHFSLLDEKGNNVFDNGTPEGSKLLAMRWQGVWKLWQIAWLFLHQILILSDEWYRVVTLRCLLIGAMKIERPHSVFLGVIIVPCELSTELLVPMLILI